MDIDLKTIYNFLKRKGFTINKGAFDILKSVSGQSPPDQKTLQDILEGVVEYAKSNHRTCFIIDEELLNSAIKNISNANIDDTRIKVLGANENIVYFKKTDYKQEKASLEKFSFRTHMFGKRYQFLLQLINNSGYTDFENKQLFRERLSPIENIIGSDDEQVIFGIISEIEEGKCYCEDPSGSVELNFEELREKIFGVVTWGSFVVLKGVLDKEERFEVHQIYRPIIETREVTCQILDMPNKDLNIDCKLETSSKDCRNIVAIISDVYLDQEKTLSNLDLLLEGFKASPPQMFVLMGNFSKEKKTFKEMKKLFEILADLVKKYSLISDSQFLLIPGPGDTPLEPLLPRNPLCKQWTQRLEAEFNVQSSTSPSYLQTSGREAVVIRERFFSKIKRNVCLPPDGSRETPSIVQLSADLIYSQHSLSVFPYSCQPVWASHWSSMSLFPLPDVIFVGDEFPQSLAVVKRNEFESEDTHQRKRLLVSTGMFGLDSSFVLWYSDLADPISAVQFSKVNK